MTDVLRSEFDLAMELDGKRYPVVQFLSSYGLNEIPRARCLLALGRRADTGQAPSPVHTNRQSFRKMSPVKVLFRARGSYSRELDWPDQDFVIFEGRLTGIGYQKVAGNVQFVAELIHWLGDLSYSSSLSANSHPANPTDYTFQAVVDDRFIAGAADLPPSSSSLFMTSYAELINFGAITSDLWGEAIKPLFCQLARQDHIRLSGRVEVCVGLEAGTNTQALAALSRIEGDTGRNEDEDCSLAPSCYTPKLSLAAASDRVPSSVADSIRESLLKDTIESYAHQTFWGKLVGEYAPTFMFALVPQAERALVVPYIPGLRDTYCKRIDASDYDHIDLPAALPRPIRAVGIWHGIQMLTGVADPGQNPASLLGVGGCYAPELAELADGMILLAHAPPWLANVTVTGYSTGKSSGISGHKAVSSATTPTEIDDEVRGHKDDASLEDILRGTKDIFNEYAHALYVQETLRGRGGQISGKLRFDIAPGATVKIVGTAEKFLGEEDELAETLIGCVARVSIGINCESGRAGTGFQLTHVRSETENKDDLTSIDRHPLYTTTFLGAPLIPGLAFTDEGDNCCED